MRLFRLHKHILRSGIAYGVICLASVSSVSAEPYEVPVYQRNQELSVFLRSDPSLTPTGIIVGSYTLYPSLTTDLEYTDNVFSNANNEQDDLILNLKPQLNFRSEFDRHQLDFFINAQQRYHEEFTSENRFEYDVGTKAKYEINSEASIPLNISYAQRSTSRGDPDDTNVLENTEYRTLNLLTGLQYSGQMLDIDALIGVKDYDYDNTATTIGFQNNQDRNRTDTEARLRLGLSSSSNFSPYVFANYRDIDYDDRIDDSGFNRSAEEIEGGVGAFFNLSSLTRSSVEIGYLNYDPEDPAFSTVNDLNYRANITWEPSTLLAFFLTGERGVAVTTINNQTASIDSTVDVGALYELTPSIFLRPAFIYQQKDYEGTVAAKLERTSFRLGMDFRMNRNVWWNAQYQYTNQDDPDNSPFIGEYDKNNFLISVRLQF